MSQSSNRSNAVARAGMAIVVLLLGTAVGCFNPKIESGNLKCAPPNNACPDGFTCVGGVCVSPRDASVADVVTKDIVGTDLPVCATPIAPLCALTAGAAVCDPVCQTGCPCGQRCTVSTAGTACGAQVGAKALGQLCDVVLDDCAPGLACLREACGRNLGRCYRFCRDGSMCGAMVGCATHVNSSNDMSLGQLACDLAPQACDPIAGTGCPDPALSCFVTDGGRTVCDCPGGRGRREGQDCRSYDDCAEGLACLQSTCVRLCRSQTDCAGCAVLGEIRYCPIGLAD